MEKTYNGEKHNKSQKAKQKGRQGEMKKEKSHKLSKEKSGKGNESVE